MLSDPNRYSSYFVTATKSQKVRCIKCVMLALWFYSSSGLASPFVQIKTAGNRAAGLRICVNYGACLKLLQWPDNQDFNQGYGI